MTGTLCDDCGEAFEPDDAEDGGFCNDCLGDICDDCMPDHACEEKQQANKVVAAQDTPCASGHSMTTGIDARYSYCWRCGLAALILNSTATAEREVAQ